MMNGAYKILIDWYLSRRDSLPAWLAHKADKNTELGQYLDREEDLNCLLASPKNREKDISDSDLADRILARLDADDEEELPIEVNPPISFQKFAYSLGGAAAVLALGLTLWNSASKAPLAENGAIIEVAEVKSLDVEALAVDLEALTEEDWKNPLDQEIEYVMSDAKDALRFLASSFLPEEIVKENLSELSSKNS